MRIDYRAGMLAALVLAALIRPASAGPGFAYSWLSTDKSFERCMTVASDLLASLAYPHIQRTRFGVTGETESETLYINCEDLRHVSVVLIRPARPRIGEIDDLVALLQKGLDAR